jgi:hypothetical protein
MYDRDRQLEIESARVTDLIDQVTGTTAAERRAAIDQRINAQLAALGRDSFKPFIPSPVASVNEVAA